MLDIFVGAPRYGEERTSLDFEVRRDRSPGAKSRFATLYSNVVGTTMANVSDGVKSTLGYVANLMQSTCQRSRHGPHCTSHRNPTCQ
jgi:hypothetical protein